MSTACSKGSTSKLPSSRRNFIRFSEARLQAESSTCMYSLQGLEALIRPDSGQVCQRLMIVSYWTPGSAQRQAASAIWFIRSRAGSVFVVPPPLRATRLQSSPASTASMNSSVTRTELLAFWYWIEVKPSPSIDMSKPASRSASAFSSSLALHQMKCSTSGWSMSSTTIFAARRVLPPDLIVPAQESAPRMKLTGPLAVPPFFRGSIEPRMLERLIPEPEPPRKIRPSFVFQSRIDSIVSSTLRMKQAEHCGVSSKPTLNQTGELKAAFWLSRIEVSSISKRVGVLLGGEVAALAPPVGDRPGDPADHLFDRALALGAADLPAEVLLGDDVGRVLGPALGELDPALLEGRALGIADHRVADLPLDLVEGMHPGSREPPLYGEALQTVFGSHWWRSWTSNFSSRSDF